MKALFVANLELDPNEGIYKKVYAQAKAVGKKIGECEVITRKEQFAQIQKWNSEKPQLAKCSFLEYVKKEISSDNVGFIYVRHMIPSPKLISVLRCAKQHNVRVYYEIPTYPYFGEQFKTSRRKHRAIVKILLDILHWPFIYLLIDRLVIIKSSTKAKCFSKMVEITNGVDTVPIKSKSYKENDSTTFRMVAVGTLYPYHGYDRILNGLVECNERINETSIEFHIVGNSQTIDDIHCMADRLGLKNVYFHGTKTTEELNEMYEEFNVGLGCLALHRRNADIDTTLKVIEYYCRGVPVVTSGIGPLDNELQNCTIRVPDSERPININDIFEEYYKITKSELCNLSHRAKCIFSWDSIIGELLNGENQCIK